jgi:hypothetical protein
MGGCVTFIILLPICLLKVTFEYSLLHYKMKKLLLVRQLRALVGDSVLLVSFFFLLLFFSFLPKFIVVLTLSKSY